MGVVNYFLAGWRITLPPGAGFLSFLPRRVFCFLLLDILGFTNSQ